MNSKTAIEPTERIIRVSDVAAIFGVSVSTIYDWQSEKSKRFISEFPKRIRFGNSCSGFLESEVTAYISLCKNRQS